MSYAKALKKAQCESVEITIRKRRLLFAGAVQRTNNERLTRRVMFGTMAGGENPGPGRPEKNWAQCLVDDLRVFQATEGSTESSEPPRDARKIASHRGIHGKFPSGVRSRDGVMADGGQEGWEVVSGSR